MKLSSKKIACVSLFFILFLSSSAIANDSTLDSSFGTSGKSVVNSISTGPNNNFQGLIALPDGKFIQVGYRDNGVNTDFAILKLNANGNLDTTFDGDGILIQSVLLGDDIALGITQQTDGKFLIVGSAYSPTADGNDFAIIRMNADGTLDNTFSGDGIVTTDFASGSDTAHSVAIQADGKIVVAGWTGNTFNDFAIARYTVSGVLDSTFSSDGKVIVDFGASTYDVANDVVIQSDGKIVVAGYSGTGSDPVNSKFAVVRINENGELDNTFSSDGKVDTNIDTGDDVANSMFIQTDGKIVLAGSTQSSSDGNFALVRYNSVGVLDTSFSSDGISTLSTSSGYDYGYSLLTQSDGKFLVAGESNNTGSQSDFALARFNFDGSVDTSFGLNGFVTTDFGNVDYGRSIAMQSTGQILVSGVTGSVGNWKYAFARYGVISSGSSGGAPAIITIPPAAVAPLNITNPSRVSNSTFKSYSGEQLATIAPSTFKKLPDRILKLLTSDQTKNLTSDQLKILTPLQVSLLSQSAIGALKETQIEALQPSDFKQMSVAQISKISDTGARGLSTSDIKEFSTEKLRKLKPTAIANLKPNTLKALNVAKLKQLTQKQKASITLEQKATLSRRQINAIS